MVWEDVGKIDAMAENVKLQDSLQRQVPDGCFKRPA